ncbi:peptidase M23 [Westiellopsis prolifica IICB1]|nr:peptidase M23 [Westiellopsis prolifica IICB1]
MTQRNNSAPKRLDNLWRRSLPAQSICLLSSFSLLSSGMVLAQTESAIDNIVPTTENSPTANKNTVERSQTIVIPEKTDSQPEFSQRRSRLRQRLRREEASQPPVSIRARKSQTPVTTSQSAPRVKVSTPDITPVITQEKPQVEFTAPTQPSSTQHKVPVVTQPVKNSPSTTGTTAGKPKDYNNAYIDPTDYNPTAKYEAPSSVIATERTSGCQAVLNQGVASNSCTSNQPVANGSSGTPSWLKKSQNVSVAAIPITKRLATNNQNNTGWRPPSIVSKVISSTGLRSNQVANLGSSKSNYHPNRFIPSPSNFTPTTTVSEVAIAPSAGKLTAPITADSLAPRPSVVAYEIPLATTLPQIAYRAIYGNRIAAISGTGFMYPLSIRSPITSLFGWRVHPITGDRRFHSGMDIGAAMGTPILAAYSGQVEVADWVGGYGQAVILNHNNALQTLYGHMSQILVQPGQRVERGTVIGLVGSTGNSTGPHLHFEVRQMTSEGWVAVDPRGQIQSALGQLEQGTQTAQVSQ